jgi:hypothetical protein
VTVRLIDETQFGVGWIESASRARTSHALVHDGAVWLVDPIEPAEVEGRVLALGEPAGVIQLLDRHNRDAAEIAARLDVPLHVVPRELPGAPFELLPVRRNRFWQEVALWWPEQRVLVCADALGTIPFFRAGGEVVGVHPFLRFRPPRALHGLGAEHLLVGHGRGLHGSDAGSLVDDAIRNARRRIPRWLGGLPRIVRRGG